jgi:hypothetical protein
MAKKKKALVVPADVQARVVGRTIKGLWVDNEGQVVLRLDDASLLFAWRDPEGNGPGTLVHAGAPLGQICRIMGMEETDANAR